MKIDELRAIVQKIGGIRATARALGCSTATIHRYVAGFSVPSTMAARLRMAEWDTRL